MFKNHSIHINIECTCKILNNYSTYKTYFNIFISLHFIYLGRRGTDNEIKRKVRLNTNAC